MSKPIVSIITISFNAEKTIEKTIKSVLSQKSEDLEYIIIDGGSTDNTLSIIKKYENQIDLVISEPDNGISDAFNKGIKRANGEVIGIINADDLLGKGAVKTLVNNIESDIDIYRGNIIVWNEESNKKKIVKPTMDLKPKGQKIVVAHPGTFITKNAYIKYGLYDLNCKIKMDYELLIRFSKQGAKLKYIDYCMAVFRCGGISTDKERLLKSTKKSINETRYVLQKNNVSFLIYFIDISRILLKRAVALFSRK